MDAQETFRYQEKVASARTEALFIILSQIFGFLAALRWHQIGLDGWTVACLLLFLMFLFYCLNYHTLTIRISAEQLLLQFGIFCWKIPLNTIASCHLDDISLWRIGGAGIHFTFIRKKYRAYFNFLEDPRVVIPLKVNRGPVQEIAFTTRQPEAVMQLLCPASPENPS
ncbi:MAG: hypothetical protein JXB15_10200 [Anaerolineales bacterium]|nr:hypothetical protein [Anaerolineales bacterium]